MSARLSLVGRAWRGGAFLFLAFVAVALVRADTTQNIPMVPGADADIRITVPGNAGFSRGFVPLRVRIVNRSSRERRWDLTIRDGGMYRGTSNETVSSEFTFAVNGGDTREFVVFAAAGDGSTKGGGGPLNGTVRGPSVEHEQFMIPLSWSGWAVVPPVATEPALVSAFQPIEVAPGPRRIARRAPSPSGVTRPVAAVTEIDPAAWPADWRMWSGFSVVVFQQTTWEKLDEARRRAAREWVAMGGRLLLVPAERRPGKAERLGGGEIVTLSGPLPANPDEALAKQFYENRHGGTADWLAAGAHWTWPASVRGKPERAGWLTFFVIAFGVLVGPVNLFVFAPSGRRHRLFWTVPAISVGGTVLLFGAIMFGDGFGGSGVRRSLVVLLPEQNQAVIVQQQISRAGLLGSRRFTLPSDTLTDLVNVGEAVNEARQLVRKDDLASGDWFVSRGVQSHIFRRLVPTRERIELTREADGTLVAQSTASAVLRDFTYRDETLTYWTAGEVPPGQRVKLQRSAALEAPAAVKSRAPNVWPAGAFYAHADKSAIGLLPTLSSIRWSDDVVLYTGQLAVKEAKP